VDPQVLPPDAQLCVEEAVIAQDILVQAHNIRFLRHVYYSPSLKQFIRGIPMGWVAVAARPAIALR
jgi:hypothetical protein